MKPIGRMQIGKNGISDNFIESLKNCFKRYGIIKVSVLKSAGHDREKVKKYGEEILDKLGKKFTVKIIGFVIVLKKWRKAR